jgi:hypothetical protein
VIRIALLLFMACLPAHQFHYSATEINWNANELTLEIIATLHADDIEALMKTRTGRSIELGSDSEALVCRYVSEVFAVRGTALRCLGMKVGREFIDVYLEGKPGTGRPPRYLRNQILLRELSDQKNQVILKKDGKRVAVVMTFEDGDDWKIIPW